MPGSQHFEEFLRDCAFGLRNWVAKPGVAVSAAPSLSLGIGATTANSTAWSFL